MIAVLLAAAAVVPRAVAQEIPTPRILVQLPANVRSDAVWIRYLLTGAGTTGDTVKAKPNTQQYVIYRRSDQQAKIVMYAPGCQFKIYVLAADGPSEVFVPFVCDPLPTRTVIGFLPPSQIPRSIFSTEKKLRIVGELEGDWICDLFLRQQHGAATIIGGSCLTPSVPLGAVGELDPAEGGAFQMTIPDFTRDPVYQGSAEVTRLGRFGVIEFLLEDETVGRALTAIKPVDSGPESGLNVQEQYSEPVQFTSVR